MESTSSTPLHRITDLRPTRGQGGRTSVFLDGRLAFTVAEGVASDADLQPEQELTDERIAVLVKADAYERCLAAANRYLAYRPRSRAELNDRLRQRGFDGDTRGAVVSRLEQQGLLDEGAFARFWIDSREASSPRSRMLTRIELQRKGVTRDVIDQALGEMDDEANARNAAMGHLRSLSRAGEDEFRRRLGAYLKRRGFAYDVIGRTVAEMWKSRGSL